VAAAVISWRAGGAPRSPLAVARTMPWRTIVVLDLLIVGLTVLLALLAIIPGVVFYTYFVLAAPVAKIDHVGVREAMRRSFRLVRGNFWRVLFVLFVVVVVAGAAEQLLQTATPDFIGSLLVNLVVQLLFSPVFGLAAALMVFDLRRPASP
jgi:membrane-anchored glycerophosphoryl diester phosphodiesterase (GDPDase)